jgi:DNA polymerase (family 10)
VDKKEVARILEETAAMLELAGENRFKVIAYENGARAVLGFPGDLSQAVATRELLRAPGIGAGLFAAIESLLATGKFDLHEELSSAYPPSLRECLRVPGFGARKAKLLYEKLGVDSIEALERACREGTLAQLKGFGAKTAERILKGIAVLRASAGYHRYPRARARAEQAAAELARTGLTRSIEIAGSLRRRKEVIRDIDLVATSPDPAALAHAFRTQFGVAEVIGSGETKTSVRFADGLAADLRVVSDEEFGAALLYFTGSELHNTQLRGRAKRLGLKLNEYGLFHAESQERLEAGDETWIYRQLGLPFIEPELREGRGEIEAAERGELPRLVEEKDLRGLIHIHTNESDGRASLEEMLAGVDQAGYEYAAITDHSQTASYAGGLTPERVLAQRAQIRALAPRFPRLRIFHGTEADILPDGSIDFGDEFLEGFDVVVASVHSRFGLPRAEQTERLIRAVRNPRVSILGHPSGRLLLSRDPVDADLEAVVGAAAEAGCAIEINCNPERLDLDWRLCRQAVEAGALLSIDPDAHSVAELGLVPYGVGIARKGWVTKEATLNAKSTKDFIAWLENRRGRPLNRT